VKNESIHKLELSKEKWVELAMEALASGGKNKFSLDALIKAMPVTKGSFYWHFNNRTEFLFALAEYWARHHTRQVIDVLDTLPESASAADKLWELMCMVYELKLSSHELMIRSLAKEYPDLQKTVAEVDKRRIETVRQIFSELGFEGDELEMRTTVFVASMTSEELIYVDKSDDDHERQLKLRHEFFIRT